MYTVKTIGTTRYVIYKLSKARWGWSKGLYFVHPDAEEDFIKYMIREELLNSPRDSNDVLGLIISYSAASCVYFGII